MYIMQPSLPDVYVNSCMRLKDFGDAFPNTVINFFARIRHPFSYPKHVVMVELLNNVNTYVLR